MQLLTKQLAWVAPRRVLAGLPPAAGTVLLESVRGGAVSILVWAPQKIITSWPAMQRAVAELPKLSTDLPFAGGVVGLLPYELGTAFEGLPRPPHNPAGLPEVWAGVYAGGLVWQHRTRTLTAVAWRADRLAEVCAAAERPGRLPRGGPGTVGVPTANFTREQYLAAIARVRAALSAGDTFQVNLSQRFTAAAPHVDARRLYHRLCRVNPAPFAGYLDAGDFQILSSSPELLFQIDAERRIQTWPIAGTRPRGTTPAADRQLAAELKASPKELAEHVMLVDLLRSDLGRICAYGSVRVQRLARIEKYARVQHLVSRIGGRLRPEVDFGQTVRALHPGGTITGCPKVATMRLIAELEGSTRGAYTGSLGFVSAGGQATWNILIRTLTLARGQLSFQAGGGVVAGSDPAAEYAETLAKAAALFAAIGQN